MKLKCDDKNNGSIAIQHPSPFVIRYPCSLRLSLLFVPSVIIVQVHLLGFLYQFNAV